MGDHFASSQKKSSTLRKKSTEFCISVASASVSYTAYKETGFTRAQALADCVSRGERLANIYSADEQAAINAVIINAGGTDRAFWLGMIEDGPCPEKTGVKVLFINHELFE